MATPGVGLRTVCDVLMEVSYHLVEQVVDCAIQFVAGPGGYGAGGYGQYGYGSGPPLVIQPSSTTAMYVGAMIVLGWGLPTAEVVTITGITPLGYIYTTAPVNPHAIGETILAPTFPNQQPTDPFFTQDQMLEWISRAQNEFLAMCPVNYSFSYQAVGYGQILQNTPANCIEINRAAISQYASAVTLLSRASNIVTAVTQAAHGLVVGSTFFNQNPTSGFGGVFEVLTVPSPTTLTYRQDGADGTSGAGFLLYFTRMYETTQAELTMSQRTWRNDYANVPTQWFEDRSGLYRWGTGGKPSSNFQAELLCSIRDSDTLGLLDGFLVPDTLVPAIKYKVLAYALNSDNEQSDPTRAKYCEDRFQRYVAATNRYLDGFSMGLNGEQNG